MDLTRLRSQERPKSALYLRLEKRKVFKIVKGGPFGLFELQFLPKYEKNLKTDIFEQCHSAENCKREDPLGFVNIHSDS